MNRFLFALALALALVSPAFAQVRRPAAPPSQPFPVSVFARLPQIEAPRISPNGAALAAKIRSNGAHYIAIVPLAAGGQPEIIARDGEFDQRGDTRAVSWRWADDDNLLITVSQRTDIDGERHDATRVIAYNRQTRRTTRLGWDGAFANAGTILWVSRSGPPRILLGRFAAGRGYERLFNQQVVMVDVTTGRHEIVIQPQREIRNWYADGEGNIRLGTGFDARTGRLTARYRSGGSGPFRTIIRDITQRYAEPPVPQIFLAGDRALVTSRHEGFSAVYEMDLNTMQFVRRVFGVEGYDVAGMSANEEGNALQSVSYIDERMRARYMDPRLREVQQVLEESFGAGNIHLSSADRPRQNIIFRVAAPNQAGGYYLFNTESGDVRHIGWVNTELRDVALNPVRTIRYRASDGQSIQAVLTLPRNRQARNLPLIVLPHGGPWARDYETWDIWAQPLAEMGYAVVQPNFRGSSGYGQAWEAASDGNWGMRMQDDLIDAITHLAGEGIADRRRVCIFGWSYGGYAASRAAQRDGRHYRCAITGAGVHDLPAMVAYDREYLGRYGSQYIGSAASRLADVSPSLRARDFSIPVLIVHGARDDRVPVAQSRTLVERLRRAGKVEGRDFVYIEQPRNTHHLPLEEDRLQLLTEMERFLRRHNPPD